MREIKFRAWNIKDKWMEEVLPVDNSGLNVFFKDLSKTHIIMQFTGLKDKNGKEIYEGDVVAYPQGPSQDCDKESVNLEVLWDEENGMWVADFYWLERTEKKRIFDNNSVKVIGNIHENPKLLKGETKSK